MESHTGDLYGWEITFLLKELNTTVVTQPPAQRTLNEGRFVEDGSMVTKGNLQIVSQADL